MNVAVIPARGGSKRIPRKNIRMFANQPIIAWSISTAKESGCFERIVVSTDDREIARIAKEQGAEVPFLRSKSLSSDFVGIAEVMAHAVKSLKLSCSTAVCCIFATAPLLASKDLEEGLNRLLESGSTFVIPITTFSYPIDRALSYLPNGKISMRDSEMYKFRSQDLSEAWHDAGQFYWALAQDWKENAQIFGDGAIGLPIPRSRVQDIDTIEDWAHAEAMFKALKG
ncbi:MAG: pseudaminic acid cytidylyltransferase [Aestuariivita sp.]|nr:pseudaminic acid cytidylyltransferase [Aestuariivita sp.]